LKVLALEREKPGKTSEDFKSHLRTEALHAWRLLQSGVVREIYFRADRDEAVIILECADLGEAQRALATLPLVKAGLIEFEYIPLKPYPGFSRLWT
jgi:hypothetical protein